MALEKWEYPDTGAPTASWLPTQNASYEGSREQPDWGVLSDQSAGRQKYSYKEAIKVKLFVRRHHSVPNSEKVSYETFRDTVGGAKVKFTDFLGVAHTVTFEEDKVEFIPRVGNLWEWVHTMREEL